MRVVTAALLLVTLVTTAGCSALMNTRVSYPDPGIEVKCEKDPGWTTVRGSLGCAAFVRNDLDDRAGLQAKVPRYLGAALIPLSAAIAGLAMTGTTGVPITALTLGGVAAMGEGFWLSSPQRRQAYSVGASAVQCVILNTRTLVFRDDRSSARVFEANVIALPRHVLEVNRRIADLSAELAAARNVDAEVQAAVNEEIGVAKSAVSTANELVTTSQRLVTRLNGALDEIHTNVDRIISLVNEEIDKYEPTMEAVRQAINEQNQLRAAAFVGLDQLVKDSEARAAAAEAKQKAQRAARMARGMLRAIVHESPLELARDALLRAMADLHAAMAPITAVVDSIGPSLNASGCVTKVEGVIGASVLSVTLLSPDPLNPGDTAFLLVSGGVGAVEVKPDAAALAALDVSPTTVSPGKPVTVKVKSTATPNTYLVDVVDKANTKVVKIVVKAPPPPPLKIEGADTDKVKRAATGIAPKALQYTVTGGSGTTCNAKLDPPDGFAEPQTFVAGDKCLVTIAWAPTPKVGPYTLTVTFGEAAPAVRKFTVE